MPFYLVDCDGDDFQQTPVIADDALHACDLYVAASLEGRTEASLSDLKRAPCINVSQFELAEGEVGLMKDTMSTMIPMRSIPAWRAYLDRAAGADTPTPG